MSRSRIYLTTLLRFQIKNIILATNKNARLRYEALDKCLSNFSRKYYIEDLQKACCEYLTKELSTDTTVSKRQVYADLKEMETSPSMQAPIKAYQDGQRKYYRYSHEGILNYVCQNGDIQVDVLLTESPFDDADEDSIFPGKFHKVGEFVSLLHNAIIAA